MRRIILIVALVMVFSLAGINCSAFDNKQSRETLRGFNGVSVLVEELNPDLVQAGLPESQILTDIELKLRLAGIKVLTKEELYKEKGAPFFYIHVNSLKSTSGLFSYNITLNFYQGVFLERNPSLGTMGSTWDLCILGFGDMKHIRASIKDKVDQFINAYLSVNPKK